MAATVPLFENIKAYLINPVIYLLFGLALIYFLYGLVELLWAGQVSKNKDQAVQNMIWGVVGMTIMISVYGIMSVVVETIKQLGGVS